ILDRVVPLAGRDVESFEDAENRRQLDGGERLRRRPRREVETDSRLLVLDFPRRMEMRGEHEIRSLRNEESQPGGQFECTAAQRPSAKSTGYASHWIIVNRIGGRTAATPPQQPREATSAAGDSPTAHATRETGQGIARVAFARRAARIEEEQAVMNDGACRRPELNRADPRVSIEIQWHDEVAIDVGAASGDFKRLAHRHDQVGRSE